MFWSDFLADLRADLQDTATEPRWEDRLLWMYTRDGVQDYSSYFPRKKDRIVIKAHDDGYYPIPADFVEDIVVECPENTVLKRRMPSPGKIYTLQTNATRYYVDGLKLYTNGSNTDDVLLTYYAVHTFPVSETDENFEFSIPARDMELIRIYAKLKVHQQMGAKTARLDRFKLGSGRRDDNPLIVETTDIFDEYYQKIAERQRGGAIRLWKANRR